MLSCLSNLIEGLEENDVWQFKGDAIFNLINEQNFTEMYAWKEFWKRNRFKRKKLKDFLMGRKLILKSEGRIVENSFGTEIIKVENVFNTSLRNSLEFEYLKKFRFKFEGENCDADSQLIMFRKYIEVKGTKRKERKRKYLLKNTDVMKEKEKSEGDVETSVLNNLVSDKFEIRKAQLERSVLNLTKQRSRLMEVIIDNLCQGQEENFCQSYGDLGEASMGCGFIENESDRPVVSCWVEFLRKVI
jgi:hypothetical protein